MNVISIRCIIFRRRNLDCIAVFKRINRLHNAFSEGLYTDERSVIIILDCSGKNLRSTRTVLIDKDSDRKLKTIAVRSIVLALAILIFRINNRALRQNLIQDIYNRSDQSTRIAAYINDHTLHTLTLQILDCRLELFCGIALEFTDLYVTDAAIQHLVTDTREIYVRTFHIHFKGLSTRLPVNLKMHRCAFLPTNLLYKVGQFHARCFNVIDF